MQRTTIEVVMHTEGDDIFAESATTIRLQDEGGGPFIQIMQHVPGENGIRLNPEEIEPVMQAAMDLLREADGEATSKESLTAESGRTVYAVPVKDGEILAGYITGKKHYRVEVEQGDAFDYIDDRGHLSFGSYSMGWKRLETDESGFIPHDGGECPVPEGSKVDVRYASGFASTAIWAEVAAWPTVSAYRPLED